MKKVLALALTTVFVLSLATTVYAANDNSRQWESYEVDAGIRDLKEGYETDWDSFYHVVESPDEDEIYPSLVELLVEEEDEDKAELLAMSESELKNRAHDLGVDYYKTEIEGLTDQIWAAQVEAEPGETGLLNQEFEAAYGNTYAGEVGSKDELADDAWGFVKDEDLADGYAPVRGEEYVGNYFNIEQHAMITGGTLKRFIDISSPFDGSYLHEDFEVTGEADVEEAFNMTNIEPGTEVAVLWHDLF